MAVQTPRVAVLIETSTSWGSQAVRGVVDYARSRGHWVFQLDWHGVHEQRRLPPDWRGEGVIARVTSLPLARQIRSLRVPAVNISWSTVPHTSLPQVATDERAVSRLAAEHFLERGFRHFAYVGDPDQLNYVDRCGPMFAQSVAGYGCECISFRSARTTPASRHHPPRLDELAGWLRRLPRPVAVLAWDALRGRQVTEACWESGIRVPEEVAVLAGYNDDLMCEISTPPLSGIDQCPERVGYAAAEMLDALMRGNRPPDRPKYIPPAGVVTRRSTDTLAHDDPDMVNALRFIREHADQPIRVKSVLEMVAVSRRSLEQRFLLELGRSPAAEIRRVHLQRAMELLSRTDMPIPEIASASGFLHPEVMTRIFRRELGFSPTAYRRRSRTG
jgi:LacI family transcriptional regulator